MARQMLLEEHEADPAGTAQRSPRQTDVIVAGRTVRHPLLAADTIQARDFQLRLARRATREDLLVVVPTGLGKTVIAVLAAVPLLVMDPAAKVVVLAPTRPLVQQHARFFRDATTLPPGLVVALTGQEAPARPQRRFRDARIVCSTPQGLLEDVEAGRIRLDRCALLVVDEAHRAVGEYGYVGIVDWFRQHAPGGRMLGLTASPGGNGQRVNEVVRNLGDPAVEALSEDDPEILRYVPGVSVERQDVQLSPEMSGMQSLLEETLQERLAKLRVFFRGGKIPSPIPKTQLLRIGDAIRARLGKPGRSRGFLFACMLHQGVAVEANHCLELLETQGLSPLHDYLVRLAGSETTTRAQKSFLKDSRVADLIDRLRAWTPEDASHPKESVAVETVKRAIRKGAPSRILVFAQYRDTVRRIVDVLRRQGIAAERFVGQADRGDDGGLSQDEQASLLRRFDAGEFPVLVATSVAEEGIHVPSVDLVVFYEPLVSEIRTIQRRGRTGRTSVGRVVVLWTRGTRDERHAHVEAARESRMERIVRAMEGASPASKDGAA